MTAGSLGNSDGPSATRAFPDIRMVVSQEGERITFWSHDVDVLVTATYYGGSMVGTAPDRQFEYLGSGSQATRLAGTTYPNEDPAGVVVAWGRADLVVDDSRFVSGSVITGYGNGLPEEDINESSGPAVVSSVESRGSEESSDALVLVRGLEPETAFVTARSGDSGDVFQGTVRVP